MRLFIFFLIIIAIPITTFAATLKVPSQYPTIQDAIDAAVNGDTVLVAPGTYVENINFIGKPITVRSSNGPYVTIIDGGNPSDPDERSVVIFDSGEGTDSVLEEFTLTNGAGTLYNFYYGGGILCDGSSPLIKNNHITGNCPLYYHGYGGGICCRYSSPTITNNSITGNSADADGGGIFCYYSDPVLINNTITENTARHGGGIYCRWSDPFLTDNIIFGNSSTDNGGGIFSDDSDPTLTNNTIAGNTAEYGGGIFCTGTSYPIFSNNLILENFAISGGGGIRFSHNCFPTLINNTITGNSAGYFGGGINFGAECSATLTNNLFCDNSSEGDGGGICCRGDISLTITNNTFTGNSADSNGGGIWCDQGSNVTVVNTIFWNNGAYEIYLYDDIFTDPSTLTISYSDLQGGKSSIYLDPSCTLNWGEGMIDADPLLIDPVNGDFHITWLSPCINRGANDGAPGDDIDGDPRPYMGTVDMGADEFTGIHPLECDTFAISESSGGILNLKLNGGIPNAGRNYLIYGSISGTAPGTPLPGGIATLPINWDMFTNIVADVNYPDSIIFTGFFGTLDSTGQMNAVFDTNGPVPGMAGYTVSFAYPLQGPPWDFVSNPINIEVMP